MELLTLSEIRKSFGDKRVIDNLSFSVPEHSVYGFLGQNGAGKTTTMKMILGLVRPDSGIITVSGERVRYGETETNRKIGYLPDVPEFYGYMKPAEYLSLCGKIGGLDSSDIKKRSAELLSLVGLKNEKKKISGFSRGMKQRLGFAQAMLNNPELLICDEPTSALDPIGRRDILDIMKSASERTTVLFSTHILSDAERICDRVAVLNRGVLALEGTLEELKVGRRSDILIIDFMCEDDASAFTAYALSQRARCPVEVKTNGRVCSVSSPEMKEAQRFVYGALSELGLCPEKTEISEPTLEGMFVEVVK